MRTAGALILALTACNCIDRSWINLIQEEPAEFVATLALTSGPVDP